MQTKNQPRSKKQSKRNSTRQVLGLRGRGDYTSEVLALSDPIKRIDAKLNHLEKLVAPKPATVRSAASSVGRTLGNFLNQGDLGALAGDSLAKLFGHGDYEVSANSLMPGSNVTGPIVPKFSHAGKRGTRITEREFLGDISSGALLAGSSVFTVTPFAINPLDRNTFPWLNPIASQFDQWELHGMVFEFVSSSSEFNGTSQALGTVIMATDYDILDTVYLSKAQMENSDFACSTRPSQNLLHGIECDPKERTLQVMYTHPHTTPQFSTPGNFQIATVGCNTAGTKLGELWVSYDISFYKKQLTTTANNLIWARMLAGAVGVGAPLLSNTQPVSQSGIVIATGFLLFPPQLTTGRYLFCYSMLSTSVAESYVPTLTNCVMVSSFYASTQAGVSVTYWFVLTLTAPNASITMGVKAVASGTASYLLTEITSDIVQ